jgi:cystathionine gamma-synthase
MIASDIYCLVALKSMSQIVGDLETTSRFIDGLRIPYIAPSLGGCESLVEQPTIISYW